MPASFAYLALAALSAPWWWALLSALLADIRVAGAPFEPGPSQRGAAHPARLRARAVDAATRTPLNRKLAFQGVARRVAARRRWEGGFGRRGL